MQANKNIYFATVFSLGITTFIGAFFPQLSFASTNKHSNIESNAWDLSRSKKITRIQSNNNLDLLNLETSSSGKTKFQFQLARQAYSGKASWYGGKFHGRLTANGEVFDSNALTAAHPTLPFGTKVKVTNLQNGRSVVVRINDRGPFIKGRIIDVSAGAARKLNMINSGVATVQLEILGR